MHFVVNEEEKCVFVSGFGGVEQRYNTRRHVFVNDVDATPGEAPLAIPEFVTLPGAALFISASNSSSGANRAALINRNNPFPGARADRACAADHHLSAAESEKIASGLLR